MIIQTNRAEKGWDPQLPARPALLRDTSGSHSHDSSLMHQHKMKQLEEVNPESEINDESKLVSLGLFWFCTSWQTTPKLKLFLNRDQRASQKNSTL